MSGRSFLPNEDCRLLLAASWWLLLSDLSMRLLGSRPIRRYGEVRHELTVTADEVNRARRYAVCLERAARWQRALCLRRSVALCYWLGFEGLPASLRIGVRSGREGLEAHAWVELDGTVVNEEAAVLKTFVPLIR